MGTSKSCDEFSSPTAALKPGSSSEASATTAAQELITLATTPCAQSMVVRLKASSVARPLQFHPVAWAPRKIIRPQEGVTDEAAANNVSRVSDCVLEAEISSAPSSSSCVRSRGALAGAACNAGSSPVLASSSLARRATSSASSCDFCCSASQQALVTISRIKSLSAMIPSGAAHAADAHCKDTRIMGGHLAPCQRLKIERPYSDIESVSQWVFVKRPFTRYNVRQVTELHIFESTDEWKPSKTK